MQRTLKREFKELEIVESEAIGNWCTTMVRPQGTWAHLASQAVRHGSIALRELVGSRRDVRSDCLCSPYLALGRGWHQSSI